MTGALSKHESKGYRLSISYYRTAEGKLSPKVWWLGQSASEAQVLAELIRYGFQTLVKAKGLAHWTPEAIEQTKEVIQRRRDFYAGWVRMSVATIREEGMEVTEVPKLTHAARAAVQDQARKREEKPEEKTLYQAIDAFCDALRGKRVAESHKQRAEQVLKIGLKRVRQNCPLSTIDFLWIDKVADHYKARPAIKSGKSMRPATVKVTLQYLRQFFVWLDDTSYGGWEAPRKLMKPFRVRLTELMTPAELRAASNIKQFDMKTLRKLYSAASDFQRAIMLTALFTGATQQELAVMEKAEFDLDAGVLCHYRNKTRIEGRFYLPPELVELLKKHFKERPDDLLAFRTRDGNALVSYVNGKKISDAVRQSWDDLRMAAELPNTLSFKYLRKFLADWITRHGGESMGQIALSHSGTSILRKHYTSDRDFEKFIKLQKEMYADMQQADLFKALIEKEGAEEVTRASACRSNERTAA